MLPRALWAGCRIGYRTKCRIRCHTDCQQKSIIMGLLRYTIDYTHSNQRSRRCQIFTLASFLAVSGLQSLFSFNKICLSLRHRAILLCISLLFVFCAMGLLLHLTGRDWRWLSRDNIDPEARRLGGGLVLNPGLGLEILQIFFL